MVTKNKWLYPSEELSKMQPGTVFDSKTYPREIKGDSVYPFFFLFLALRIVNF